MRKFIGLDRAVLGLLVVAVGVMLLLDNTSFRQADLRIFDTYWPALLIAWGLWGFIANGFRLRLGFTVILLAGIGFQLDKLGLWRWDAAQFWPVLIVVAGLFLILGRPRHRRQDTSMAAADSGSERPAGLGQANSNAAGDAAPERRAGPRHTNSSDTIRVSHILGGGQERVTSQDFQGGEISAILGGMELDLRDAGLHQGRATLDATIVCGGLELRVPRNWRVNLQATTLLGGTENRHQQPPSEESTGELTITGTVVCGGIEIRD